MKGNSSHVVNYAFAPPELFRWHESYAAFSVDKDSIERVRTYILDLKLHHANDTRYPYWERTHTE